MLTKCDFILSGRYIFEKNIHAKLQGRYTREAHWVVSCHVIGLQNTTTRDEQLYLGQQK